MPTYTKLEYIESTGTQYIDLGFKLSSNHAVDLDLQMVKINANIFGSRYGAQNDAFTLFANGSSILTDIGGTRNSTTATTNRINVYLSSSKIKIGTFERNISTYSFTTPGNGYIFNISYSRPQSYMASMKLYGCKIYLSGTLIRDLVPCKYNNQIGLWDTINGSFLGNAGTGEFIAGPEISGIKLLKINGIIQPKINGKKVYLFNGEQTHYDYNLGSYYTKLNYIESTGTQYIDSLLTMEKSDSVVMEISAKLTNNESFGGVNGYLQYKANVGSGNKGIIKVDYNGTNYVEKIYFEDTLKETNNWSSFSSSNNKIGIIKTVISSVTINGILCIVIRKINAYCKNNDSKYDC